MGVVNFAWGKLFYRMVVPVCLSTCPSAILKALWSVSVTMTVLTAPSEGLAGTLVWLRAVELALCLLPRCDSDRERMSPQIIHK